MMVGRPIPAGLSRVVSWLRCPVCAVPLELTGRTLGCENHHCFDVARQGHLNLLLRAAPKNADTPEMIAARDRFLSTGWYEPLTRTVVTALDGACRVLEAGAGTGHHIAAFGFGDVYARPGLDPRSRQLVTIGVLTALGGCEPQLRIHIGAALNVGLTREEIVEAILHASVYAGFPRALNATFVAREVFAERDAAD